MPNPHSVLSVKAVGVGTTSLHVQRRPTQLLACNYLYADHAMRSLGHPIVAAAKSVSSKAYGSSPGAKQSCSNLTGCHRPSAICSYAVRAKLPVKKNRSSVSRCGALVTKCQIRSAAASVLTEPCVQALLLAGALDSKAGSSTGQRQ